MCLIVFDWRPDALDAPLFTLAANRDEFFRRTAEPMHWWSDAPGVLAGRDLVGGGAWLGMTRGGRFAALTNYRAPHEMRADAPTRGTLVSNWLTGALSTPDVPLDSPLAYLERVARDGAIYNGFNLLIGDWSRRELAWYCNRSSAAPTLLESGTHGISNAVLDTAWPKLVRKRAELRALLEGDALAPLESLVDLMRDPRLARDDELPSTGIPLERERVLSAAFIESPEYGTRGTTALRVLAGGKDESDAAGSATLRASVLERSDDNGSHRVVRPGNFERSFAFKIEG
ncbi:NRDE family protein [Paraburkholderia sp. DHOC27]|uniref:NRDE family protein n=1 Tax=Paraburkholderia sp. DHOC27 TaxID=2303330 RepID=UPI000E3DFA1B|nr:NRDE family protein [Paraburkholderia sp. DHOC27]RFU47730.1 NRDE family protein [Paraburkholderia sp. DHOC27]